MDVCRRRLLTTGNTSADVFADSVYRSAEIEAAKLKASGFKSRIHRHANRNHPLSDAQTRANRIIARQANAA
jgi:IS5 family transposase